MDVPRLHAEVGRLEEREGSGVSEREAHPAYVGVLADEVEEAARLIAGASDDDEFAQAVAQLEDTLNALRMLLEPEALARLEEMKGDE